MKVEHLEKAIDEAERFIESAKLALSSRTQEMTYGSPGRPPQPYSTWDARRTAACKRASMDLTRALADMRRRGEQ